MEFQNFKVELEYTAKPIKQFPKFDYLIPRAIFNDEVEELKLRAEGYSGRRHNTQELTPFKLHDDYIDTRSGRNFKAPETNQDFETTAVFTELGMEILNMRKVEPLPEIAFKPKITCPVRIPVHFMSQHKSLPSKFPATRRFGEEYSIAFTVDQNQLPSSCQNVQEMIDSENRTIEANLLRYNREFRKPTVNKSSDFTEAPGYSFRGTGSLEKALKDTFEPKIVEKSLESLNFFMPQSSTSENHDSCESLIKKIDATTKPVEQLLKRSSPSLEKSTEKLAVKDESVTKAEPVIKSEPVVLKSIEKLAVKTESVLKAEPVVQLKQKSTVQELLQDSEEESSEDEWLKEQKNKLFGQWGRSEEPVKETPLKASPKEEDDVPVGITYKLSAPSLSSLKGSTASLPARPPEPTKEESLKSPETSNEVLDTKEYQELGSSTFHLSNLKEKEADSPKSFSLPWLRTGYQDDTKESEKSSLESLETVESPAKSSTKLKAQLTGVTPIQTDFVDSPSDQLTPAITQSSPFTEYNTNDLATPILALVKELDETEKIIDEKIKSMSAVEKPIPRVKTWARSASQSLDKLNDSPTEKELDPVAELEKPSLADIQVEREKPGVVESKKESFSSKKTNENFFEDINPEVLLSRQFMSPKDMSEAQIDEDALHSLPDLRSISPRKRQPSIMDPVLIPNYTDDEDIVPDIKDSQEELSPRDNNPHRLSRMVSVEAGTPISAGFAVVVELASQHSIAYSFTKSNEKLDSLSPMKPNSPKRESATLKESPSKSSDEKGGGLFRKLSKRISIARRVSSKAPEPTTENYLNAFDATRLGVFKPEEAKQQPQQQLHSKEPSQNSNNQPVARQGSLKSAFGTIFKRPSASAYQGPLYLEQLPRPNILEFNPMKPIKVVFKGVTCTLSIDQTDLNCIEKSKDKPVKHFFPLDHRRIIWTENKGDTLIVHAITSNKGKPGSKQKKISLQCESSSIARQWAESIKAYVYGDDGIKSLKKQILVLVDKFEGQSQGKMVEKYMRPVWDLCGKVYSVKNVEFSEFSMTQTVGMTNFAQVSNVVTICTDFTNRLNQIIIRNGAAQEIANISCDADPVDAALMLLKSAIFNDGLCMSALNLKREEGAMGFFKF